MEGAARRPHHPPLLFRRPASPPVAPPPGQAGAAAGVTRRGDSRKSDRKGAGLVPHPAQSPHSAPSAPVFRVFSLGSGQERPLKRPLRGHPGVAGRFRRVVVPRRCTQHHLRRVMVETPPRAGPSPPHGPARFSCPPSRADAPRPRRPPLASSGFSGSFRPLRPLRGLLRGLLRSPAAPPVSSRAARWLKSRHVERASDTGPSAASWRPRPLRTAARSAPGAVARPGVPVVSAPAVPLLLHAPGPSRRTPRSPEPRRPTANPSPSRTRSPASTPTASPAPIPTASLALTPTDGPAPRLGRGAPGPSACPAPSAPRRS